MEKGTPNNIAYCPAGSGVFSWTKCLCWRAMNKSSLELAFVFMLLVTASYKKIGAEGRNVVSFRCDTVEGCRVGVCRKCGSCSCIKHWCVCNDDHRSNLAAAGQRAIMINEEPRSDEVPA
ncbi:uncharacterized protein LOC112534049 isoform X2 [Ricinus communis]|nr:uncharacterized protein LOC112534049 isoform X2 [Ricinus communis]|eukprot:XP_025012353.1 uncharacterized protein LOC112534049 isoform X2 [Ricinus communis]